MNEPHRTSEGEFGIGSTLASKYTYGGGTHDIEYEVTAFDPPTRYDMVSREGPFPFEGSVELAAIDEGATLIRNTIDAGADGAATKVIFAVGGPIVRYMMRKQLHGELEELKEMLESDEFDS